MKVLIRLTFVALVVLSSVSQVVFGASAETEQRNLMRVYEVNKAVCDFPEGQDLSTPEAAYATIMRDYMATGASSSEWSEISTWQSDDTERKSVSPERIRNCLNAHIHEVIIYKTRLALVIAKMREYGVVGYDTRMLFFANGRWLNIGQDELVPTMEEARYTFFRKCERMYSSEMKERGESVEPRWNRQPVANPQAHLKPFIQFLKDNAEDPHTFVMRALAKYKLVIIGEIVTVHSNSG